MCCLWNSIVQVRKQVRLRFRLAFLPRCDQFGCDHIHGRLFLRDAPGGNELLSVRRSPRAHFRRRTSSHRQEILHKLGFPVVHAGRGQQQHRGHQWSDPPTPRGGQSRAVGSRRARQTSVLNAQLVKNSKYSELSILDLFFQEIEGQFCAIDIFLLWLRQRPHPSMYFAID